LSGGNIRRVKGQLAALGEVATVPKDKERAVAAKRELEAYTTGMMGFLDRLKS